MLGVNIPPASWGHCGEGRGQDHPTPRFIPAASCGVFSLEFYKAAWEIYEFLDEWAMIISAGVTLMLAITVGWVIMDNHRDRKVDRIQRLQNDVISWATEVMKALFVTSFKRQTVVQENMREKLTVLTAVKIFTKTKAAELMPDGELARKVENAGTHLEQFIKNLEHTSENDFVSLETPWKNLKQEFLDIIESASSIVIPEFK